MPTFTALKVPADIAIRPELVEIADYKAIQMHVGGIFDVIRCEFPVTHHGPIFYDVWVHDEGLILDLPINMKMAELLRRKIVGDVLVSGAPDHNGEVTSVHPALAKAMLEAHDEMQPVIDEIVTMRMEAQFHGSQ